jgi:hypothetical protein
MKSLTRRWKQKNRSRKLFRDYDRNDERAFRFIARKATDSERFRSAVPSIVGRRLTYRGLTGNVRLQQPECHASNEDDDTRGRIK